MITSEGRSTPRRDEWTSAQPLEAEVRGHQLDPTSGIRVGSHAGAL